MLYAISSIPLCTRLSTNHHPKAEEALNYMLTRANAPHKKPFGKLLSQQGVILQWIAQSRIAIDSARLIVLNAAAAIDAGSAKSALSEIAEAKILVPNVALEVIDRAVQIHGAQGMGQDTPLAQSWAHVRTVRVADGPDEAHLEQLGRRENKRAEGVGRVLSMQRRETERLMREYGVKDTADRSKL